MIKGFYTAVSAMLAGVQREKLLAHNAANLETPGFKEVMTAMSDFRHTAVSFPPGGDVNDQVRYVGNLGLGVQVEPEITNYAESGIKNTGSSYDLAINGPGFFRIRTPQGERLTRDGRFLKDATGQLVTTDGNLVLGSTGQPIKLPEGNFVVSPGGDIMVNNKAAGKLGIYAFQDPSKDLVRAENNTFTAVGKPAAQALQAGATVMQGMLEMSNVNPSELMTQMVTVSRAYEAAQKMVQNQDELLGRAISSLGRIG
jgi:flagellar basal body rod protein FlgG